MERFACYHQPHLFAQCVLWRVQSGMEQIHFDASMDYDVTQNGFRHYHVEQMRKEPDGQTSEMVTDNDFSVRISTTETLLNDGESHAFTRITAISTSRDGEKDWRRATSALLQSPENQDYLSLKAKSCQDGMNILPYAPRVLQEKRLCRYFWDSEIFMLPFYIKTNPKATRNLLMYRYHTLVGTKRNAQRLGYCGAKYPR